MKKFILCFVALAAFNCYAENTTPDPRTLDACKKVLTVGYSTDVGGQKCPRCCPPWDPNPCCVKC